MTSAGLIRAVLNVHKKGEPFVDQLSGETPVCWRGFPMRFAFGIFDGEDEVMDVSDITAVMVEIHYNDPALRKRPSLASDSTEDIDSTLAIGTWRDWTKQHGYVDFSASDMNLDLDGKASLPFWIAVYALLDTGAYRMLGTTTLTLVESGVTIGGRNVAQGANLIPSGSVYDGSGEFELSVTQDRKHNIVFGDNDTSVFNDPETVTVSGSTFTTNGTTVVLSGTPGEAVTAVLRYPIFATLDETEAFVNGKLRTPRTEIKIIARDSGQLYTLFVENGQLFTQPVDLT